MCKKVARLTRVIFILNTKNDENDVTIKIMKKAYENELTEICNKLNEQISVYQEKLADKNNSKKNKLEEDLKKFKKKIQNEKRDAANAFENYKE